MKEMKGDMLVAATDTTAATIVWAMTALMKNPRVMKKVQEEVRNFGDKKDFLDEDDINRCRRICPGMHMAVVALDLLLANFLYSFDWDLPEEVKSEDVDVEALPGLVSHKKNHLFLIAKTR
ncbi:hypothetical protein PIB30_023525 [Stylosanthes scabra]|uniref:Uncharacterized protein n=1 Tax=Stylosanthes scabra TaxID=79078 RepID=A0ABU6U9G6_9FABA|nr:hypothetical protein [Stylosanthes scabra]